jgi:Na+-translocating ferredoxin:NAD+ oxidoreductase RNF subunit RnfB
MQEDVYKKLAKRLDETPNGFPSADSGIELKLLAKIFTPDEAALASEMRLSLEPLAVIADRAGVAEKTAYRTLRGMLRKGQITVGRQDRKPAFGLLPFAVGFWEEQLPRMDVELAELFEQYFAEVHGLLSAEGPPVHRVIPVEEAVPSDIEILPYESASQMLESAKAWGVRDCMCRQQQKLVGKGCDRPVENCLVFAPVEGVFDHSDVNRAITKEEAFRILHQAEEDGLVHSPGNYQDGHFYICNCCSCCCGILRSVAEYSVPTAIAKAAFFAVVDADLCAACGDCLERCHFDALALSESEGVCEVELGRCVGCGLCVPVCPTEALRLERWSADKVAPPPGDYDKWMDSRAAARGITAPY